MKRLFTGILLLSVIAVAFVIPVSADNARSAVYDRAGVFTPAEAAEIEKAANEAFSKLDADIYIVTDDSRYVSYYGEDFINEYGIKGSAIVLIITDNYNRNYDMYTYGKCGRRISDAEVDDILDDATVYNEIKNGRYKDGAIGFINLSAQAYRPAYGVVVFWSLMLGLGTAGVTAGCIVSSYKRKQRSEIYPLSHYARLDLTLKNDRHIGTFVTKRRIQTSSSTSRGGRSGGRSGGGGGSGHRGGR